MWWIVRYALKTLPQTRIGNWSVLVWALFGVVIVGSVGFVFVEGWSLWRGLYFTLVTITSVGYSDEGISEAGCIYAVFLLAGGIGVVSYTFALFIQSAVTDQLVWGPVYRNASTGLKIILSSAGGAGWGKRFVTSFSLLIYRLWSFNGSSKDSGMPMS